MELIQPLTADEYLAFAEEENADPRLPSECTTDWVWARALDVSQSLLGRPAGKWTIRGYAPQIDALWGDIRILTRAGLKPPPRPAPCQTRPGSVS